jgi:hypothetical protein
VAASHSCARCKGPFPACAGSRPAA